MHTIRTIFQEISLKDTLRIERSDNGFQFSCNHPDIPKDETNLCIRAWNAIKQIDKDIQDVRIELDKQIPVGAGLGGGSSNAAAVLTGINEFLGLGYSNGDMERMAVKLGADVPFFIKGGVQYAEGIGDELSSSQLPVMGAVLLVSSPIKVSTAWAYAKAINYLPDGYSTGNFPAASGDTEDWKFFENDFEPLVFQTYPEIGTIKDRMLRSKAVFASLSGSGSTVFGIFDDEAGARKALSSFSPPLQTFLAHPIKIRN
tara:strand:- start:1796 stop:2569 length:774 start_codon:yes stop_codon:yes gene_type:complete